MVDHRLRFIRVQVSWMLVALVSLALLGALTVELFFYAAFVGFLLVTATTAPASRTARWRRSLRWFVLLGTVVFVYLIGSRLLAGLPAGAI